MHFPDFMAEEMFVKIMRCLWIRMSQTFSNLKQTVSCSYGFTGMGMPELVPGKINF